MIQARYWLSMLALCALSGCALVAPQHDAPGQSELVCRPGADAHQDAQKIPLLLRQIEDAERAGVSETGLLRLLDPLGNAYENTDRFGDAERVVSRALDIRRRIASTAKRQAWFCSRSSLRHAGCIRSCLRNRP